MRFNPKTGKVRAIYNVNSEIYNGSPDQIARQYLLDKKELFKGNDNLDDLEILEIKKSPAGYHVCFRQIYAGIPVLRSETVVSIKKDNRISMVVTDYKTDLNLNTTASLGFEQAIGIARTAVGTKNDEYIFPPKTELVIYRNSTNKDYLCWQIFLYPIDQDAEWFVLIDAHKGIIMEKENTVKYYVEGTGKVFDPDPGTTLRNASLPDSNDADYSILQSAYDTVTIKNLNNAVSGVYTLRGKYAWSEDIMPPSIAIVEETDSDDFIYSRNQNGFEEVNIYYFIDKQRTYIDQMGFDPTWEYEGQSYQAIHFDAKGLYARQASYHSNAENLRFGTTNIDAGEDQSVILHEYGHALHDALINNGTDIDNNDTQRIGEGISDYMAISYRRTTQPNNPYRPNYRNNWWFPDVPDDPIGIYNIALAKYPEGDACDWDDKYEGGKIWASTLMDMEYNTATDPSSEENLGR